MSTTPTTENTLKKRYAVAICYDFTVTIPSLQRASSPRVLWSEMEIITDLHQELISKMAKNTSPQPHTLTRTSHFKSQGQTISRDHLTSHLRVHVRVFQLEEKKVFPMARPCQVRVFQREEKRVFSMVRPCQSPSSPSPSAPAAKGPRTFREYAEAPRHPGGGSALTRVARSWLCRSLCELNAASLAPRPR